MLSSSGLSSRQIQLFADLSSGSTKTADEMNAEADEKFFESKTNNEDTEEDGGLGWQPICFWKSYYDIEKFNCGRVCAEPE